MHGRKTKRTDVAFSMLSAMKVSAKIKCENAFINNDNYLNSVYKHQLFQIMPLFTCRWIVHIMTFQYPKMLHKWIIFRLPLRSITVLSIFLCQLMRSVLIRMFTLHKSHFNMISIVNKCETCHPNWFCLKNRESADTLLCSHLDDSANWLRNEGRWIGSTY